MSCSRSILTPSKPENVTLVASDSLFSTEKHSDIVLYRTLARSRDSWQTEKAAEYVLEIVQCVPSRSRFLFPSGRLGVIEMVCRNRSQG